MHDFDLIWGKCNITLTSIDPLMKFHSQQSITTLEPTGFLPSGVGSLSSLDHPQSPTKIHWGSNHKWYWDVIDIGNYDKNHQRFRDFFSWIFLKNSFISILYVTYNMSYFISESKLSELNEFWRSNIDIRTLLFHGPYISKSTMILPTVIRQ